MKLVEKDIISACKRRDREGQYAFVRKYSSVLMTVCRRYAPDRESAKDMLQEALIHIFKNIDKYQPTGSFEGWIKTVTIRCSIDWLRRQPKIKKANVLNIDHYNFIQPKVFSRLTQENILRLIQELPSGYKTVFNLYVIDGVSHKEIGLLLDITESASRSQLARARKLLQEKINLLEGYKSTKHELG